jgi:hypothetical protein
MPDTMQAKGFDAVRFCKGLLVYVCLWPGIASLTYYVALRYFILSRSPAEFSIGNALQGAADAVIFGYRFWFTPAVIIGTLISGLHIKSPSFDTKHVALIGSAAGFLLGQPQAESDRIFGGRLASIVFATLLCWMLMRRLRLGNSGA